MLCLVGGWDLCASLSIPKSWQASSCRLRLSLIQHVSTGFYCNSLMTGFPDSNLTLFQSVFYAAATVSFYYFLFLVFLNYETNACMWEKYKPPLLYTREIFPPQILLTYKCNTVYDCILSDCILCTYSFILKNR